MPVKLYAIARNTFVETIRQPIYGVLLAVTAGLIILSPSLAAFSLESGGDQKVMKDVCLATLLLFGLLASVFSATAVMTREITDQTVLTVVSKPVSRPVFLVGKYLGVCGAMVIAHYLLSVVFLFAARHGVLETAADPVDQPVLVLGGTALLVALIAATFGNYVYGWHFASTVIAWAIPVGTVALLITLFFKKDWATQAPTSDFGDMKLIHASIMIFFAVLVLTAFAVAFASRFSQVVTLTLCASVYLLGLLSDYYLGRPAAGGEAWVYNLLYAAVPNFQYFWAGNAITQELPIPPGQVFEVGLYAVLYSLGVLGLGVALFQTREVG